MLSLFLRSSILLIGLISLLSGCASSKPSVYREEFDKVGTFSRDFHASATATCEAARRTLLSQGYVIGKSQDEQVEGSKNFQPNGDAHVVINFHVVCASDGDSKSAIAFANALQDQYVIKKQSNSASLGVNVLGTLSLPIGSSADSMIKVGSETIQSGNFYDRFFALVEHYLAEAAANAPAEPDTESESSLGSSQ